MSWIHVYCRVKWQEWWQILFSDLPSPGYCRRKHYYYGRVLWDQSREDQDIKLSRAISSRQQTHGKARLCLIHPPSFPLSFPPSILSSLPSFLSFFCLPMQLQIKISKFVKFMLENSSMLQNFTYIHSHLMRILHYFKEKMRSLMFISNRSTLDLQARKRY